MISSVGKNVMKLEFLFVAGGLAVASGLEIWKYQAKLKIHIPYASANTFLHVCPREALTCIHRHAQRCLL